MSNDIKDFMLGSDWRVDAWEPDHGYENRKYEVVSVRNKKGFIEEYAEGSYTNLPDAIKAADKSYDHLTNTEVEYYTVQVRTNFSDYGCDVVYER